MDIRIGNIDATDHCPETKDGTSYSTDAQKYGRCYWRYRNHSSMSRQPQKRDLDLQEDGEGISAQAICLLTEIQD